MERIVVKLKQYTPLLHFQPGQKGATLRASEVKPRLDKFLFGKSGIKYKLTIHSKSPVRVSIPTTESINKDKSLKKDPYTYEQLYETKNYPQGGGTLVVGNIGGRLFDKVINLVFYKTVSLCFFIPENDIADKIVRGINLFVGSTNFGNRKTKGFGSYSVISIERNGNLIPIPKCTDPNYIGTICEKRPFTVNLSESEEVKYSKLFKRVFSDIQEYWGGKNGMKRIFRNGGKDDLRNVLLGTVTDEDVRLSGRVIAPIRKKEYKRIPSPLLFKPNWSFEIKTDVQVFRYTIEVYFVPEVLNKIADLTGRTPETIMECYDEIFDSFNL